MDAPGSAGTTWQPETLLCAYRCQSRQWNGHERILGCQTSPFLGRKAVCLLQQTYFTAAADVGGASAMGTHRHTRCSFCSGRGYGSRTEKAASPEVLVIGSNSPWNLCCSYKWWQLTEASVLRSGMLQLEYLATNGPSLWNQQSNCWMVTHQ